MKTQLETAVGICGISKVSCRSFLLNFSVCVDLIDAPPTQKKKGEIIYNVLINQNQIQINC